MAKKKRKQKRAKKKELLTWQNLALVFGLYWFAKNFISQTASRVGFGVPNLKITNTSAFAISGKLILPVHNKLDVNVPIDSFVGVLSYGNNKLSDIIMPNSAEILANSTTEMVFDVELNFAQLGTSVLNLITSGQYLQQFRVVGTLSAAGLNYPLNQPIKVF